VSSAAGEHLLHRLAWRATERAGETAVQFAENGLGPLTILSWGDIDALARRARAGLQGLGLARGDRLLLQVPTGPEYLGLLLGAFMAGIVPSTLHALGGSGAGAALDRELSELVATLSPRLIVASRPLSVPDVVVVAPQRVLGAAPADAPLDMAPPYIPPPDAPAYIQFTSGSTGRPRGIVLTWPAILANLAAIARCAPILPRDHLLSWLPMYHDMGLFGALLTPLYIGGRGTFIDTQHFMNGPLVWFRLIEAVRPTLTVTPPSALQTCIQMAVRRPFSCDLSSLEQIICGAEPVSQRFVRSVARDLARFGLRPTALRPVYGLAEATLAVSFPPEPRAPRVDHVEPAAFETRGIAIPAATAGDDARAWVSAGVPIAGTSLEIVDEAGCELPERHVGRLMLRTPSLYAGYLEAGRFSPRQGEWFDTGDLGYIADGELYVTGRRKDLIIKHGRNYSPDRMEELVCLVDGVRRAAAFGLADDERATEKVVVLAEARPRDVADAAGRDHLRLRIRRELTHAGYAVDVVSFVDRGSLPRTTSGKLRRQLCRELFAQQTLAVS
jgi:acyl-CoA synthetase (AMP-forming)/AMP-acid ligase II